MDYNIELSQLIELTNSDLQLLKRDVEKLPEDSMVAITGWWPDNEPLTYTRVCEMTRHQYDNTRGLVWDYYSPQSILKHINNILNWE